MHIDDLNNCIEAYGRDIYSFCCYLTHNRQEADDLYQDTFLKALELAGRLDPESSLKNALLSIAMNLWRNKRRKTAWRQRITGPIISLDSLTDSPGTWKPRSDEPPDSGTAPGPAVLCDPPSAAPQPSDVVIAREEALAVRQAVASLPDRYRLPVLLFYTEEMSIADIAAVLDIPQGTVKSRLHKAKKRLAQELKEVLDET